MTFPKDLETLLKLSYYKTQEFKELDNIGIKMNTKTAINLEKTLDEATEERIIEFLKENGYQGEYCSDYFVELLFNAESVEEFLLKMRESINEIITN